MQNKRELGQYFTQENPFTHPLFQEWMGNIGNITTVIEPFAGANNILRLIKESGYDLDWACFDIDPPKENTYPKYNVEQRDTLADFPKGYDICITNCPYLGKSSARRRKIDYPWEEDDLYKVSLRIMMENCKYVAVIIPESFITANIHMNRLWGVISLNCKMFDDTECPVCLAMFTPDGQNNIPIWNNYEYLGCLNELQSLDITGKTSDVHWVFNDKDGSIGVKTVDSGQKADCEFFEGEKIPSESIKVSSRSFTRVSGLPDDIDRKEFLKECNIILADYREKTKDVLMTSFKGLRKDGKYRRRLDFKTVKSILNIAIKRFRRTDKNEFCGELFE